ncbi:MAG: GlsB/YeaQ/YmgE family stress response membrane protein [Chloroflexota bacterium]
MLLDMDILGWIVVGFIAGAISGALVGGRTARGCLPNVVVGILGGVVGGWLAVQMGFDRVQGFMAAVVVAVFGALVVRLVLNALNPD